MPLRTKSEKQPNENTKPRLRCSEPGPHAPLANRTPSRIGARNCSLSRLRPFMPMTRQESRKELAELQLPVAVLSTFDGQLPHPSLSYRCRDPHYIFSTPTEPDGIHITPLWECGISVTAYQHTQPRGRFITFSLEQPEDVTVLGASFQSVAAALLIVLWEDEVTDDALREIARLLDFHHFDRLLHECESRSRAEVPADYEAWHTRFLESCENDL